MVAFIFLPMLYHFFFRKKSEKAVTDEDSRFFLGILRGYKSLYKKIFSQRKLSFGIFLLLIPAGLGLAYLLETRGLPPIEKFDAVVSIDWNEPIGVEQNKDRVMSLLNSLEGAYLKSESDIGVRQFCDEESSLQEASLYFLFYTLEED